MSTHARALPSAPRAVGYALLVAVGYFVPPLGLPVDALFCWYSVLGVTGFTAGTGFGTGF